MTIPLSGFTVVSSYARVVCAGVPARSWVSSKVRDRLANQQAIAALKGALHSLLSPARNPLRVPTRGRIYTVVTCTERTHG